MNIHFVGIGGIGISALAQFCFHRGDHVSGSNLGSNRVFEMLLNEGITSLYDVHDKHNLPTDLDLLVYSEAIPENNPERLEAKARGIKEKSYFEFLGDISHEFTTIAVAGTHGKTTTTGLIATGFQASEFDATIFVGSTLESLGGKNFHQGSNKFLLLEACEYRENFRFLKPDILLITNIEWDHADYFKSEEQYLEAFKNLAQKSKNICFHQNDEATRTLLEDIHANKVPIPEQSANSWEYLLKIFGSANQQNATLALGLAHMLEINTDRFKEGLGQYVGAGRRQEFLGTKNELQVFDDYGHHPTEIKVTIEAFRQRFPDKRIGLIFEPHQYSRTRQFFDEFLESFSAPDFMGLFPIYEARDTAEDKAAVSIEDFIKINPEIEKIEILNEVDNFCKKLEPGDILLFMGAGKISDFAHKYLSQ